MSLVYNNDKPIGKCESYSIDKIPSTTPFVMLTNYEPLRSELNENQQVVLDWLKNSDNSPFALVSALDDDFVGIETIYSIPTNVREAFEKLSAKEQFEVLAAFAEWGMKHE